MVWEKFEFPVCLPVELHEYEVPDFDYERIALVHELASRYLCDFFVASEVNVDFTAWSARARVTHFPEVVVFISEKNVVFREIFQPCPAGLLVEGCPVFLGTLEYGGIEFSLVYLVNFGEKLPCP